MLRTWWEDKRQAQKGRKKNKREQRKRRNTRDRIKGNKKWYERTSKE